VLEPGSPLVELEPGPPPVLEPGSPLVVVSGTTPEVVDGSAVVPEGSPVVDVVAVVGSVVVVGSVAVVALVVVVMPFDSEPAEGSVALPPSLGLVPVVDTAVVPDPPVDAEPVPDALASSVPDESPPQATRRRPRGAAQSGIRNHIPIPTMATSYA